jgi:transposase
VQRRWLTASREDLIAELERQEREREALIVELERQQREIERLRREHERADRDRNRYRDDRDRLRRKIDHLEDQLDDARRKMYRQAAPFSRGAPTTTPRRPGRRAGRAYGRQAHRAIPGHVDEHHRAPLPPACPHCDGPLRRVRTAQQYQEDLPIVQPVVRLFTIEIGRCRTCGRRVQGRHPLQTSEALGAAAAQVGPQAITLAAVLHTQFGLPLAKVSAVFRQWFGLHVTPGGLVHALHRAAARASPTYDALRRQIQQSDVVTPDETGWKVGGRLQWLWAFATPTTTVYAILPGRGYEQAASILGPEFAGTLVRDGWAPYRRFDQAIHQTCVAHLLRRCRALMSDHREYYFAPRVQHVLHHALAVRDRYCAGAMSPHGLAVARGHLHNQLNALIDRPGRHRVARHFAAHLAVEFPAVFTFLLEPDAIDATNWRAEHALRPAVVTRKVCGGNRSERGAQTQQILSSVLQTMHQRELDATRLFDQILRSPHPTVLLASPTAAALH